MNRIAVSPHGFSGWWLSSPAARDRVNFGSRPVVEPEAGKSTVHGSSLTDSTRSTLGQSEDPRPWAFFTDTPALGGGVKGGEREHARHQEEVVENGVYVVVVGVAAAGTVQTTGDAGLPEMCGVVAGVALGETNAEVLGIAAGEGLEMVLDHLNNGLGQGHVDGGLGEAAEAARELG